MPRNLQGPSATLGTLDRVLDITEGGTNATTDLTAVQNLGGIHRSMINRPGGIAGLDSTGRLPVDLIDADVISIQGPVLLNTSQTATYTITNFDNFTSYALSANVGTVSRVEDVITYTAPGIAGIAGFKINDRVFDIAIGQSYIKKPVIQSPVNMASNLGPDVLLATMPFDTVGASDVHASSIWEVAEDVNFNAIPANSGISTTNKTSWTAAGLKEGKTFYARVKHIGVNSGESQWSDIIQFSSKSMYLPVTELQKVTAGSKAGYTALNGEAYGYWTRMSGNGQVMIVGTNSHDLNVGGGAHEIGSDYCDIYVKNGDTWNQVQRIFRSNGSNNGARASVNFDGSIVVLGTRKFYGPQGTQINLGYSTPVSPLANTDGLSSVEVYNRVSGNNTWSLSKTIAIDHNYLQTPLMVYPVVSSDGTMMVIGKSYQGPKLDTWLTANADPVTHTWVETDASLTAEVLVYRKTASDWVLSQTLTVPNGVENPERVGLSRDNKTILVYDMVDGSVVTAGTSVYPTPFTGSIHVFKDNGSGQFAPTQVIKNPDAKYGEFYGLICDQAMSSNGSVIAAAVSRFTPVTSADTSSAVSYALPITDGYGFVDIWELIAGQYVKTHRITPAVPQQYSYFGRSVWMSPDGTTLVVGSEYNDTKGPDAGLVYIFKKSPVTGNWSEVSQVFPASAVGNNEKFGIEVSVSDDMRVMSVGAWTEDPARLKSTTITAAQRRVGYGAVYLFG